MNTFRVSRTDQKAATRTAILDAARAEFESVGFDTATIRGIAARAGVAVGTVMAQGDKRELLHAALFESLEDVLAGAIAALADAGADDVFAVDAGLDAFAATVLEHYQARPGLSRAMLKESLFAEGPWAARFAAQTARSHAAVAHYIERAVATGAIEAVNATMAAGAWLSFFYFALIGWVQGQVQDPRAFARAMTTQHLTSRTPRTPHGPRTPDLPHVDESADQSADQSQQERT
jgi:AcrR family transcriptional regulator